MHDMKQVWLAAALALGACDNDAQPARPTATGAGPAPSAGAGGGGPASSGGPGSAVGGGSLRLPIANGQAPDATGARPDPAPGVQYATSQGATMLWKRPAALEADLMRALALGRDEVCTELGARSCTRDIHTIALGGNDPFRSGINRPSSEPTGTTSIAVDRVVLSACNARARADKAGPAKVFTALDLRGGAPSPEAPAVDATIRDLYRRLLARDPRAQELAVVRELLDPAQPDAPQSAEAFATLACYAIGSSLEFLFN
jgi:hypothetical protein